MRNSNLFCTHFAARRLFAPNLCCNPGLHQCRITKLTPTHAAAASGEPADRRPAAETRAGRLPTSDPTGDRGKTPEGARAAARWGAPVRSACGCIGRGGRFGPTAHTGRRSAQRGNGRDGGGGRPPVCAPSARVTTRGSVTRGRARPKPARWWGATRVGAVHREQQGIARTRSGAHAWRAAPASGATRASTL